MKSKQILTSLVLVGFMFSMTTSGSQALLLPPSSLEAALGNSFSYQGYITYNGQPANGAYDFKFSLWEDSGGVTQVGSDITADDQIVSDGYFTVVLDFGAGRFQGDKRWLKIEVRPGAETGAYNPITPLQELTPTPYALFAKAAPWAGLSGVPGGFADGVDNNTQYSAGNGLTRTGSDPNYTFQVDTAYVQRRVGGTCPSGQAIASIDATGGVTCQNTDYTAGSGLTLSTRQFSADTTYLQRRVGGAGGTCAVGSAIRVINSDGTVTCETDDNTTYTAGVGSGLTLVGTVFSTDSTVLQRRVSSSCRPGSTIQKINSDGTIVCGDDAPLNRPVPPAGYVFVNPMAPGPLVGNVNQVTIGADGLPLILFSDTSDNFYKVVHCGDPTCTTATAINIDTFVPGNDFASMALDPDGRLQISYYKQSTGDLWFARCADIACTSVVTNVLVASPNDVGSYNDIIIARDGFALVVYADITAGMLDIVHCYDRDCLTPRTVFPVDPGPITKPDPSITLGADGLALVAYLFAPPAPPPVADLKVAYCTDVACTANITTQLITPQPDGFQPSITTGADALGLVVYWDMDYQQLVTVHCGDYLCSNMVGPQPIHSLQASNLNPQPMVTIGASGLGVITFFDIISGNNTQAVAHCNDLLCSAVTEAAWIISKSPPAITISPTGNPLLTSPGIGVGGPLQVILCQDPFCVQYFRRR